MSNPSCRKAGFTLIEVLMSTVISVMVFAAMGSLLVKTMRLWTDGAGSFYLANQARAARARLLSGGLGVGTGLLSINEVTSIKTNPQWCFLDYNAVGLDEKYSVRGSVNDDAPENKSIFVKGSKGAGESWLMMTGAKRGLQDIPDVQAASFGVAGSNKVLNVTYKLSYTAGGRTYEYPQRIQAYLVNITNSLSP